jgi:hypothetical protein
MKPQKIFLINLLICLATLVFSNPVLAQDTNYRLVVNRDFGYGNGSDVRGNFSLKIYGNQETIRAVTYLIDGKEMAHLTEPPFH